MIRQGRVRLHDAENEMTENQPQQLKQKGLSARTTSFGLQKPNNSNVNKPVKKKRKKRRAALGDITNKQSRTSGNQGGLGKLGKGIFKNNVRVSSIITNKKTERKSRKHRISEPELSLGHSYKDSTEKFDGGIDLSFMSGLLESTKTVVFPGDDLKPPTEKFVGLEALTTAEANNNTEDLALDDFDFSLEGF
jgi:hypothetical protein